VVTRQQGWDTYFKPCADQWYDIATSEGIDPLIIMSWAINESAFGSSKIAHDKANLWGWNAVDGDAYNSATNWSNGTSMNASGAMEGLKHVCRNMYDNVTNSTNFRYQRAVEAGYEPDSLAGVGTWYASDPKWGEKALVYTKSIFSEFISQYCVGISLDGMDESVQTVLNEVMKTWSADMESGRITLIEKAASIVNKGCHYSQAKRDPANSNPAYLDCSAYVAWAFTQTGHTDVPISAYTGTFVTSSNFKSISESELIPGDIGLNNSSTAGGNGNHIGIYIGKNSSGQNIWLHCSSSGIDGPQVRTGNGNFRVFYRYTNW